MARIEEKRKENLSSVVWTWVVVGILSAVVITGIVLGILYIIDLNNKDDDDTEFAEQFPDAQLITFAELDNLLDDATQSDIQFGDGEDGVSTIYIYVYSPDYETYSNGAELEDAVSAVIGLSNFYVINVEAEDNSGYSIDSSEFLSQVGLPSGYPYLLAVTRENFDIEITENGIFKFVPEIKAELAKITVSE